MDLHREMDRITQPPAGASRVRVLSAEEVAELERVRRITPLQDIPKSHAMTRVSMPAGYLEFIR